MSMEMARELRSSLCGRVRGLVLAEIAAVVLVTAIAFTGSGGLDFEIYHLGALAWLSGADPYGVLPATSNGTVLPFTCPPFALAALLPRRCIAARTRVSAGHGRVRGAAGRCGVRGLIVFGWHAVATKSRWLAGAGLLGLAVALVSPVWTVDFEQWRIGAWTQLTSDSYVLVAMVMLTAMVATGIPGRHHRSGDALDHPVDAGGQRGHVIRFDGREHAHP